MISLISSSAFSLVGPSVKETNRFCVDYTYLESNRRDMTPFSEWKDLPNCGSRPVTKTTTTSVSSDSPQFIQKII